MSWGGGPKRAKTYGSAVHAMSWSALALAESRTIRRLQATRDRLGHLYWTRCHPPRWLPGLLRAIRRAGWRDSGHSGLHALIARNNWPPCAEVGTCRAILMSESPKFGPCSRFLPYVFARLGLAPQHGDQSRGQLLGARQTPHDGQGVLRRGGGTMSGSSAMAGSSAGCVRAAGSLRCGSVARWL
jgi:hypothetical protein